MLYTATVMYDVKYQYGRYVRLQVSIRTARIEADGGYAGSRHRRELDSVPRFPFGFDFPTFSSFGECL